MTSQTNEEILKEKVREALGKSWKGELDKGVISIIINHSKMAEILELEINRRENLARLDEKKRF